MKRLLIYLMLILALFTLVGCKDQGELEDVAGLYPAYIIDGNKKLWGYIDSKGEFVVDPIYDTANDFNQGLALVEQEGLFGILDTKGRQVLKPEYTNINKIFNGYMTAFKDNKLRVYDYEGEEVALKRDYRNIGVYSDGLFNFLTLDEDGELNFGYINNKGEEVLPGPYEEAYSFNLGRAIIKTKNDKDYKLIDKKGKVVKKLNYEDIKESNQPGIYIYSSDGQGLGLLDKDGQVILEDRYSSIVDIKEDLVVVGVLDGEVEFFSLMDLKGNELIPPNYNDIKLLGEGFFGLSREVGLGGENLYRIYNRKLEEISDIAYYNIGGRKARVENNLISVATEGETLALDIQGKESKLIPKTIGYGEVFSDGKVIRTIVDDEMLYYNMEGSLIWEVDETYHLYGGAEVIKKTFGDDGGVKIRYPHLIGIDNKDLQSIINNKLINEFIINKNTGEKVVSGDYKYFKTSYKVKELGSILEIEKTDQFLDNNKVEEDVNKDVYNINLNTGDFYKIQDIFKLESPYLEKLNQIINETIVMEPGDINLKNPIAISGEKGFRYRDGFIYFYINYNRSDSILRGYDEVEISLEDLGDLVDKESDFFLAIIGNKD